MVNIYHVDYCSQGCDEQDSLKLIPDQEKMIHFIEATDSMPESAIILTAVHGF